MADDSIQHGIDDDPNNDPHKAKNIGGVGGAVTGAVAGAAAGPLGAVAGAVVGGVVGAVASKAAVKEVDKYDNDNTYTGVGHGVTHDSENPLHSTGEAIGAAYENTKNAVTGAVHGDGDAPGNGVPGVQTGGLNADGSADTRGITEKTADAVTGDKIDDKTGKRI